VKQTGPGLHIWFPAPIGQVFTPNVDVTNTVSVGFRSQGGSNQRAVTRDVPVESLMLTGDQNIIDIDFVVQWRIKSASDYLFNIRDPQATVKIVAESAIREVIGRTKLEDALTKERQQVEARTKALLQNILDEYKAGVAIAEVKLQKVDPPKEVIDAFNDVQRAKQDQERKINEAAAYKNDIIPRAKGEAQKMLQDAEAYKQRVIDEAKGEASRFLSVYEAYKGNKAVTKRRIYLETMQNLLKNSEKIIIDQGKNGGQGVVPYLPLPELKKRSEGKK
jgi:membrane protease subunit HflK